MHHAFSKPRFFGDKKQQRYMSTLIVLRQNKTMVSCAQKTDSTNDPTKMINTKINGRHKYLLVVHTTSIYVPLYSNVEHRVLLPIGRPLLSGFFQRETFLDFSPRIHRNAHSDRRSCCFSLFIKNNTSLPKKHANPSNAIKDSFCFLARCRAHSVHTSLCTQCVWKNAQYNARTAISVLQPFCGRATKPHALASTYR